METQSAANPRPNDATLDTHELRQQVVTVLSLVFLVITYVGWWHALIDIDHYSDRFVFFMLLFVSTLYAFLIRRRNSWISACQLILASSVGVFIELTFIGSDIASYFYVVPVVIGFAISPLLGMAAALLNTCSLLVLARENPHLTASLSLLWFVTTTEWLSQRKLYTVLHWAWSSQQHASRLLNELRLRRGELNRTLGALTEANDRLQRANHELAVARQEAEEACAFKEQFAANVSHELLTPLNLVVGFAEMLYLSPEVYDGASWTPELVSDIGELYRAGCHLQGLVNDVLDLSRIDARRLPMFRELVDLRSVIGEAGQIAHVLVERRHLSYRVEYPSEVPLVLMDRTRIRQVMVNLLNNAARFTDDGSITVRVKVCEHEVLISVQDTGSGVAKEDLERIFEEYRQAGTGRGRGGMGLGLSISRQFVTLHGGRMWAESKEGEGSVFHFALPLPGFGALPSLLQHTPSHVTVDPTNAPLILVDPDPSIAEMMARYLGDIPIVAASDGVEAEQLIGDCHPRAIVVNESPDAPGSFWLGYLGEASRTHNVPVLRCSIPSPSWLWRAMGIDGCLTKPVSRDDVAAMLRKHREEHGPVLVVDDDRGFVALMARMLSTIDPNFSVLCAYDGAEAIQIARRAKPGLMLLDLLMPEVDGFEVARTLRQDPELSGTAIVAVTATSYAEDVLARNGSYLTITQPGGISAGTLAELLSQIIRVVRPSYIEQGATDSRA